MEMKRKLLSTTASAICALSMIGGAAVAQDVTLRSTDGNVSLTGELVGLEGDSYIIRTARGELRVAAGRVECIGLACPSTQIETVSETTAVAAAPAPVASETIAIAGSETIGLGLMPLLLEGYAASIEGEALASELSDSRLSVTSLVSDGGFGDEIGRYVVDISDSNGAFDALINKSAQIGMSARRIVPDEARALRADGAGNMVSPSQEHIVGVDSLIVVTHPDNPVEALSLEQLGQIYSGVIKNWSEVGGKDQDILVIDRPERSGTRDVLAEVFQAEVVATISPLEVRIANNSNKAAELVRENENAIGFLGYAFQRGTKAVTLVNECGLPMVPDSFSARTEEYPLQRRLYLYNRADLSTDQIQDFVDFAASPDADPFIAKSGFIGLGIERRSLSSDAERTAMLTDPRVDEYEAPFMQEMLDTMASYDRLSTTFRFGTASSRLDERGRADMARLVDYLEEQPAGTEVLLVGFTDDVGPFDNNLGISQQRAEDAFAALRDAAGDRISGLNISTAGYGEIAPTGCNLDADGRQINRRVEVWVKS